MDNFEASLNNKERLIDVADALSDLHRAFSDLETLDEEDERRAVMASMQCTMAQSLVVELLHHLNNGEDFYLALRATMRGEMKLSPEHVKEWQSLITKLSDPTRHN